MAYSDYGGYAYRNGKRVEKRSDATITPEIVIGTPGIWPGFAFAAAGLPAEQQEKLRRSPHGHAVLGDGPIFVVLRKQGVDGIYRGTEGLKLGPILVGEGKFHEFETGDYLDDDWYREHEVPAILEVDGHRLEVRFTDEDNYYVYAKLTQPDGNVWHGWSGYGVGAGLEDCGYGYSTDARESRIRELWPEAISQ